MPCAVTLVRYAGEVVSVSNGSAAMFNYCSATPVRPRTMSPPAVAGVWVVAGMPLWWVVRPTEIHRPSNEA